MWCYRFCYRSFSKTGIHCLACSSAMLGRMNKLRSPTHTAALRSLNWRCVFYTLAFPCLLCPFFFFFLRTNGEDGTMQPAPALPAYWPSEALYCCTEFRCTDQVLTKAVLVHWLNSPAASGHPWSTPDRVFVTLFDDFLHVCPVP